MKSKKKNFIPWILLIAFLSGGWSFWQYGDMQKSIYDTNGNGIVDAAEGSWATNAVQGVISNIFDSADQIIKSTGAQQYSTVDVSGWDQDSSDDITTGDVDNVTIEVSGGALQVKDDGIDTNKVSAGILASLGLADSATQPGDAVTTLDGTAHRILYVDASGNVTELAYGTDGQVLTSTGASAAPAFEDAPGGNDGTGSGNHYFGGYAEAWPVDGTPEYIATTNGNITAYYISFDKDNTEYTDWIDLTLGTNANTNISFCVSGYGATTGTVAFVGEYALNQISTHTTFTTTTFNCTGTVQSNAHHQHDFSVESIGGGAWSRLYFRWARASTNVAGDIAGDYKCVGTLQWSD